MERLLVLYASQDKRFAEDFVRAARANQPDTDFDLRDNVAAFALDLTTLAAQYGRVIALLSPDALASPAIARVLETSAQTGPGIFIVLTRPVAVPPYLANRQSISAERLSPRDLADRLFAPQPPAEEKLGKSEIPVPGATGGYLDDLDDQAPIEDEPVAGNLPPPRPPADADAAAPPDFDELPAEEAERGLPQQPPPPQPLPPPPPAPQAMPEAPAGQPVPFPGPYPEQPATEKPYYPPPPAPGGAPAASGYGAPASTAGEQAPTTGATTPARQRPPAPAQTETLQFSAYHPNETPVESWQTCLVYTHLGEHLRQIQADAGTFTELGSAPTVAQGQSLRKIARHVELTIEPHMDGVTFSPPQDSFLWRGDWHRSLFRYSGAQQLAGTVQQGWIDIYADHIAPICTLEVTFSFHAGIPTKSLSAPSGMTVTANTFDTVFISYSHRDREPMRQARETYEKLGISAYHDDQLAAGDNYDQRLSEMIHAANVFHLLWSADSAHSAEVRKEWELALACQKGRKFIRPWYWQQPIVQPPPELQALKISFRYEHLRRRLMQPSTWF